MATLVEEKVKPRLRGVSHQYAAFAAAIAGIVLVATAPTGQARLASAVYALSVTGLFAVSAVYHRVTWTPERRRWMRRLDHTMIFVLIAGTSTPIAALVLSEPLGTVLLVVAWMGAFAGLVLNLVWLDAPKPFTALAYLVMGWVGIAAFPQLLDHAGVAPTALVAAGGVLYSLGAVVYARERPDPVPAVFGYHEIFHVLVILAAACQYAAIAGYVVPGA